MPRRADTARCGRDGWASSPRQTNRISGVRSRDVAAIRPMASVAQSAPCEAAAWAGSSLYRRRLHSLLVGPGFEAVTPTASTSSSAPGSRLQNAQPRSGWATICTRSPSPQTAARDASHRSQWVQCRQGRSVSFTAGETRPRPTSNRRARCGCAGSGRLVATRSREHGAVAEAQDGGGRVVGHVRDDAGAG